MNERIFRKAVATLFVAAGVLLISAQTPALADPKDLNQLRTMVCDDGRTVEAIIHMSNTKSCTSRRALRISS